MLKYRIVFEKMGRAKFISHLDLMRTFQRAFKRAGVEVKHSEGFNPHPNISIALPLPVGMESTCEILDFESLSSLEEKIILELNKVMPEGIKIKELRENTRKTGELAFLECELKLSYDGGVSNDAVSILEELFRSESLIVRKKSKKGLTDFDIIPCIKSLEVAQNGSNAIIIRAIVAAQNPTLNPMLLADAITLYRPEAAPDFASCLRLSMLDAKLKPFK
jgi:radical SAM-linked protein